MIAPYAFDAADVAFVVSANVTAFDTFVVVAAHVVVVIVVVVAVVVVALVAVVVVVIAENGPPLPPRIVDRSRLVKLELLRVEMYPPSKPAALAIRAGSWVYCRIFALAHSPWSLRAMTSRSC